MKFLLGVATAFACLMATPTRAEVVLDTYLTDVICNGAPCAAPSFTVLMRPGDVATLHATLHYHYKDDGLLLASPGYYQMDWNGDDILFSPYESGGIYLYSNICLGHSCQPTPDLMFTGSGPPPLVLGLNDHPDEITGSVELFSQATLGPNAFPELVTLFVDYHPVIFAVPEPEIYGLLIFGLGLVGAAHRRRGRAERFMRLRQCR
jgi:hypothetical protein